MALILLSAALVSCRKENTEEAESSSSFAEETNGAEETKPLFEPFEFVSAGKSDYVIWVPSELYSNSDLKEYLTKVTNAIKDKTGVVLSVKSDARYTADNADDPAILIGKTKFAESQTLSAEMKNGDFCVNASGNKILLYGATADGCLNALRYFFNNVIHKQAANDKTLLFKPEYVYEANLSYGIKSVLFGGVELKNYRIITSEDATALEALLANYLVRYLKDSYGYELKTDNDSEVYGNEILIGNTARSTLTAQKNGFAISVNNGKVQLVMDGLRGFEGLYEYVSSTLFKAGKELEHSYADGFSYSGAAKSVISDGSMLADSNTGELRVMYYNVFWHGNGPDEVRHGMQEAIFKAYDPDVLCLQEYAVYHHTGCTPLLTAMGYAEAAASSTDYVNNTPLFYKADKFNCLDAGTFEYANGNGRSKSITWAVLENKTTEEKAIVLSTHFMYDDPALGASGANAARVENTNDMLSVISQIRTLKDGAYASLPLIMGGDLNCRVGSEPQNILLNNGLVRAYDLASTKNDSAGHHNYPTWDSENQIYSEWETVNGTNTSAIDHAFVSTGVSVKTYAAITTLVPLWASDHMPLIVDIDI